MTEENKMPDLKKESRVRQTKYFDSRTLLQGEKEIIIIHGDVEYRLRKTSQDKLILTK